MKFKALILAAAVMLSAVSFTACSSEKNAEQETKKEETTEKTFESSKKTEKEASEDKEETDSTTELTQEEIDYYTAVRTYGLPQLEEPEDGDTIAIIDTNYGKITVRFFEELAPNAVENFLGLAGENYYDGLTFHRVIDNFMIQGGDPNGDGTGGESYFGEGFGVETTPALRHFRGALCMAMSSLPNSIGSQFYIVQNPEIDQTSYENFSQLLEVQDEEVEEGTGIYYSDIYPAEAINEYINNGGYPSLDFNYTVFGQVIEGMDVVDAIAAVETDSSDKPLEDVIINSVSISEYGL